MKVAQIKFILDNGVEITAQPFYENWEQWGGTQDEIQIIVPILEAIQKNSEAADCFEFEKEEPFAP